MKFLICGLGSIGQRHVRILRHILGNAAEIGVYRERNVAVVIRDDMTAIEGTRPEDYYGLTTYDSLDQALDQELTAVFVTNPISMHLATAKKVADAGHNIFIEKPLSHTRDGIGELAATVARKNLITMVGYQLRFHPALQKVRSLVHTGAIGRTISAEVHFGEWLPGMHPYEDYRISHAARRDQGGGAILCLSHDIDYALWIFGRAERVNAAGGLWSNLEMDVEDTADLLLECERDGLRTSVRVHVDFIQRPAKRYCRIVGDGGVIHWDYHRNCIEIQGHGDPEPRMETFPGLQRNDLFVSEHKEFLAAIEQKRQSSVPLSEGIRTLDVCLAAQIQIRSRS